MTLRIRRYGNTLRARPAVRHAGPGPGPPVRAGLPARVRALRGVGLAGRPPGGGRVRGAHRRLPSGLPGRDARHRRRRRARPSRRAGHQRADRGDVRGQGPPGPPRRPRLCQLPAAARRVQRLRRGPGPGDSRTATLLGQNWDWLLHSAQTLVVLEARPDDGPDFVTVVEAGLLAKAGLNAAGLGLVTNALVTDADLGAPGLPYHVLLRAILDCATVTEALKVLQAGMRSSSANYLIAHASGAALDVEAAPGDFTRLYPQLPEDGAAPAHQPLPVAAPAPGRRVAVGHAGQRGPPATAPGRRDRVRHARRPPRAARRSRRLPAQHLLPPRSARAPARAGRHHRFGPDGPERPAAVARGRQPLPVPVPGTGRQLAGRARRRPAPRSSGTS